MRWRFALAAVTGVLTVVVLLGRDSTVVEASQTASTINIQLSARMTSIDEAALPPNGVGGDQFVEEWQVTDADGHVSGQTIICTVSMDRTALCEGATRLRNGQLSFSGRFRVSPVQKRTTITNRDFQMSVTGGTGQYRQAQGVVVFDTRDVQATVTFRIATRRGSP